MKLLVDMNLSPAWCPLLQAEGWDSVHWSAVGDPSASDQDVMRWALDNHRIVFTHDLDFSAILAATQACGPSVMQVRAQDIRPLVLGPRVVAWLRQYESQLQSGAVVVIDESRSRVRLLPIQRKGS